MSSTTPELKLENEIVRAGAGAGKTTTLIRRISEVALGFHAKNERWPKIVVSTFTRKATQELRERLMVQACKESPELLEFATSRSLIQISTIHGVLYRFLLKYGPEFGLDPGFKLVDGSREKWQSKKILKDILLESEDGECLLERHDVETLSQYFQDYFQSWLCRDDLRAVGQIDLEEILKERLKEMSARTEKLASAVLSETDDEKWREFGQSLRSIAAAMKIDSVSEAREKVLSYIEVTKRPRHMKKNPKVSDEVADEVADFWPSLKKLEAVKEKDLYWSDCFWRQTEEQNQAFERVAAKYCAAVLNEKSSGSELSLSDLELLSLYFLKKSPKVAKMFADEWDYWMIDEYQDTSPIQVSLMKMLIGSRPSFVVGDPQQSIYLFRGARSEVFAQHESYVQEIGGKPWQLMKNYRSQPELLEFFNDFFDFKGSQFQKMQPRDSVQDPARVVARVAPCSIVEPTEDGEEPANEEYEAIAQEVHRLASSGKPLDQICILGRVNRQLEKLAEYLSGRGYPVHVHASASFYNRREILDAMALLKFIVNPWDSLSLYTLLRSPWFFVEDELLADWGLSSKGELWDHIKELDNETVLRLKEVQKAARTVGVVQVFWDAVVDSELLLSSEFLDSTRRRESNLWKLYSLLRAEEAEPGFNLVRFIESSEKISVDDSGGESDAVAIVEPERINLMTIHASKGLQFDHVIIPHLDKAPQLSKKTGFCLDEKTGKWSIPVFSDQHQKKIYSALDEVVVERFQEAELQEQVRLLYVALTRAKETVFLSWQGDLHEKAAFNKIALGFSEGVHKSSSYSYEVQSGPWSSPDWVVAGSEEKNVISQIELPETKSKLLKKISVSQILEATKEPEKRQENRDTESIQKSSQIIQLGVQVHQLFEMLRYGASLDEGLAAMGRSGDLKLRDGVDYVLNLESPPMKELILSGKTEWGFLCRWNQSLIEGQIDLWGEVDGRIWIVDYKTGNPKYSEKAFRQLALYGYALSKRFENPMSLAVVYPLAKQALVRELSDMNEYLEYALSEKFN